MKTLLKALLLTLLLTFSSPAPSYGQGGDEPVIPQDFPIQDLSFKNLTIEDGLSQSSVFTILQDKVVFNLGHGTASEQDEIVFDQVRVGWIGAFGQGFIQDKDGFFWIGTHGALYKWNGIGLISYTPANSGLSDAIITAVLEDKDGLIWVGTLNGLNKYDKNTDRFTSYKHNPDDPNTISHNTIGSQVQPQTLMEDSSGVLWIGTQNGLNKYNRDSNTFTYYLNDATKDTSISHNIVSAIYEDRSNVLWIGTQGGLNKFDKETGTFTRYLHDPDDPTSISGDRVMAIFEDREGLLWIGIEGGGLNKFERETGRFTRYQHHPDKPQSIISNNVNAIAEDAEGNLWLSHYPDVAGVSVFNKKSGTFENIRSNPNDPLSLSSDNINDIYQDKDGVIWAIDQAGTVNRYDKNISKIMTFRHTPDDPNTLSSSNVFPLFEDRSGTIWAGTKTEFGLNEYVRETKSFIRHPVAQVYSICEGRAGDFWVGTVNGKLHQYDRATRQIVNTYEVSTSFIPAIIEDPAESNILWVGTHKDGLVKVHKSSGEITHYRHNPEDPDSIGVNSIWSIYPENDDIFWLGTYGGGINRFDKIAEKFTRYVHDIDDPHSISNNIAANMAMTNAGEIWIITQGGGLNRFDKATGRFEHYSIQDGNFPTNDLSAILEDHQGQLWITSNELGIIKFNPRSKAYNIYGESDGVQGGIFWFVGRAKSITGELWFGGSEGLNAVQPEKMKVNPFKPPIFLTSLTQGGEPQEIGKAPERLDEIKLHWREPFFEFEFVALNYISSRENQYAYMLEGRDKDWYYSGSNPSGRYTGLKGGEYKLKLKGSNNDGIWNEEGISIKVVVEPPFWETWWFYSAIILLSTVIILLVIYYVIKLNAEVTERKKAERELRGHRDQLEDTVTERTYELNERVKELDCLYGISKLAGQQGISLEQILEGVIDLLPPAMQYPEIACSRIVLNGLEFKTDNFQETPWQQSSTIVVRREQTGQVEVAYLEERPDADEGPFYNEERLLLNSVAERLGRITERKQAEEALRESEEKFRTLFQNLPVPVYTWQRRGEDFMLADHNADADTITGGGISSFVGITLTEMYPDRPDIVEDISRCFAEKGSFQREMAYSFKSTGEDKTLVVKYAYVSPDLVLVHTEDVTEREQAVEALQASEEKYRDLVEKVSDVIFTVDVGGVITYLNPAVESLIGLPPERVVGQPFDQFIHPDDLDRLQGNIQNLLSGAAPGTAEYRVLTASGETRWIHVTSQPTFFGKQVTGLQGVLSDITERKETEEQIEDLAAISERERLARRLHDAVTQTLFSASVIAESTPRIMDNDPELGKRNLEQLSTMLRGSLAEMRTMLIELRPEALIGKPIGELIQTLSEASQTRINCPVHIVIDDKGNPPEDVTIVFYRIAQEAFSNIIKYAEANEVSINLACDKDAIVMIVKDNGRGFEPDQVPPGHIGLNIMAERIDQIGGELTIDSKPGQGTQITAKWSKLSEDKNHA